MRRTTLEARKPASFHSRYTAPVPAPRPAPAKQPRTGRLFALFFAIAFALAACWALPSVQSALEDSFRIFGSGQQGAPSSSTEKSAWKRGTIPHLYQTDPAWANEAYAGSDVATAGCGPTCMTMVYAGLTGKTDYDPASMAAFSEANGFVDSGMTAWSFMTEGAAMLGLSAEELPADASVLTAALREGRPVIASVLPGDFTTVGHFIVIAGVDETGNLIVHDPNSPERSSRSWDAQDVLNQCANLWAYSAR